MLEIIICVLVIALDQISKHFITAFLNTAPGGAYELIKGIVELRYTENRGAAFGMMQNSQIFFLIVTFITCIVFIVWMVKDRKNMPILLRITLSAILAGAIGNMIDRIAFGYVRDFISLLFVNFAIFNIADCAITVGGITLGLDLIFFKGGKYFDELEKRLFKAKNKTKEEAKEDISEENEN